MKKENQFLSKINFSEEELKIINRLNKSLKILSIKQQEYFLNEEKISFQSILQAFLSNSNSNLLELNYDDLINDFKSFIKLLSKKYTTFSLKGNFSLNQKGQEEENLILIKNTLNEISNFHLLYLKNRCINLIKENRKEKEEIRKQKLEKELEKNLDSLKKFNNPNEFLVFPSLENDIKEIEELQDFETSVLKDNMKHFILFSLLLMAIFISLGVGL